MLYNLIKISVRNIGRKRLYSGINIVGLALTIAAAYLLYQYVDHQLSYDDFHRQEVYRINLKTLKDNELVNSDSRTPPILGKLAKSEIVGIEEITRLPIFGEAILTYKGKTIREKEILIGEPSHFKVLSYELISGDEAKALGEPFSIMISSNLARRIFNDEDPLYKTIVINNPNLDGSLNFKITGVFQDQPVNSHLRPNLLMSYATVLNLVSPQIDNSWYWNNLYTYVKLSKAQDPETIEFAMNELIENHMAEELDKMGVDWKINLQPIDKIYIENAHDFEFAGGGNKKLVNYLMMAGIFMLLVAYLNFINLYSAQAMSRFREVAIRKINGANLGQVFSQFIIQALIVNLVALSVAFTLVQLFHESVMTYLGFPEVDPNDLWKWLMFCLLSIIVSIIAGAYSSLFITSYKPVTSLKGDKNIKLQGVMVNKLLVIIQFAASVVLIYGTIVIYEQLVFAQQFDVGFSAKNKLIIKSPKAASSVEPRGSRPLKEALLKLSSVQGVSWLDEMPGNEIYWKAFEYECSNGEKLINPSRLVIGEDYFDLFEIKNLAGRSFKFEVDSFLSGVILNKKAIEMLGFDDPLDALDKQLQIDGHRLSIIGIKEDYYQESLKSTIKPQVFHYRKGKLNYIAASISSTAPKQTLNTVKATYEKLYPDSPFEYYWLDDHYNKQYQEDFAFGKLFRSFALLVILVSSMGIFALSLLNVAQKIVEVGIRKILGASVADIIQLLLKEYLLLITTSGIIGTFTGFLLMNNWLNNYVETISLSAWMVVVPVVLLTLFILIAIGYNIIKVAYMRPVKVIQQE